ncbi:spermatogenesis-associated protein 7-like protein [Lasius niger]|uniref:Spermatogenesis-associated protein 7-like protein n=1 Tax=Lasius niger TaxID=67767 RepID=A0A0J7LAU9_LASNI|nr:spermatogenesis-associated protein 7-like protein [Lasius niger]
MQETNRHSISSNASQYYDFDCDDQSVESKPVSKQLLPRKEEEKKYVKFIYDITNEIIQRGLYTDNELRNVFKKHIDRYKGILNKNKMLYEIYQLKISLNMTDDSDTDDELEDLIQAQKLLSVSEIRPPTPPKVLNDNKVMEKLESYRKMNDRSCVRRTVTLIDANPDLLVTERDVLMSLVEVGLDPKQVQYICKNLRDKSRDTTQTDAEASYPLDLKVDDSEELRENDRQISPKVETVESARDSVADDSPRSSEKQEASSSTSNLVSAQDETVETKEKIESQTTLENDKVDS